MERLIARLGSELDLTAAEIADIFWLTLIRQQGIEKPVSKSGEKQNFSEESEITTLESEEPRISGQVETPKQTPKQTSKHLPSAGIFPKNIEKNRPKTQQKTRQKESNFDDQPFKVPNAPSIREPLTLIRSLRPLLVKVPSVWEASLDETATAQKIADERIWMPVTTPILESWLELALVVEESTSMLIWRRTVLELGQLLKHYGAFRDVRIWGLVSSEGKVGIRPRIGVELEERSHRSPQELIDPNRRRLVLVVTDCVSSLWRTGAVLPALKVWGQSGPMAIVQMLPEWLWVRTTLRQASAVQLYGLTPGMANQQLSVIRQTLWDDSDSKTQASEIKVPILTLEPEMTSTWSQMVVGKGIAPGFIFKPRLEPIAEESRQTESDSKLNSQQLVQRFRVAASPMARRLAGLLAASPVISLPVIRLIQETILPKSRQVHVAEVLLGGILQPIPSPNLSTNPDDLEYRFLDESIRSILLDSAPATDTVKVLSRYISEQFGKSLGEFIALLRFWQQEQGLKEQIRPFAVVTAEVLKRWGRYSHFVREVEQYYGSVPVKSSTVASIPQLKNFIASVPPLKTFEFEVKTIDFLESKLQAFEFKVVTIELEETGWLIRETKLVRKERQEQSWQFIEELGNGVELEMVFIPEGTFLMGSPRIEKGHQKSEEPQHQVNIKSFLMGKYPVTQAQWRAVAALPQVNRKLNPAPSRFKGEQRPVERVSWYDAVEFCSRLSSYTGIEYRLPSEAEWEYAARAGTKTPFHFGETITTDLANYNGNYTYGPRSKGEYRGKTTEVGSFGVANGFGLYDIHGNVWEWCADSWHHNHEDAPDDGRAWINAEYNIIHNKMLRGGSWNNGPNNCRCAYRFNTYFGRDDINYTFGFRVVCVGARTL